MYQLMLDTANLTEIAAGIKTLPVSGVTTNPTILRREGDIDVYSHLAAIKKLCGAARSLHVQVVSTDTDGIIKEAHYIRERLGKDIYIKIPATESGLAAMKTLSDEGVNITATAIYSTWQAMLAVMSGAKYTAIFYNRMQNNCTDPCRVISELRDFIDGAGADTNILAASFKNVSQVTDAFAAGAHSATVDPGVVKTGLAMSSVKDAVSAFTKDFSDLHGEGKTMIDM